MTLDKLVEHCAFWKKQLRLQDWEVELCLVGPGDLDGEHAYGKITWLLHHKAARISIVGSEDMAKNDRHYDQERTLVHELLHLHFLAWETEPNTLQDVALEQALTLVAHTLVTMRRDTETTTTNLPTRKDDKTHG